MSSADTGSLLALDRVALAATDPNWFSFLRARSELTEVNFWRPGGTSTNLPRGTPWFFQLRGTTLVWGAGFFSTYGLLPIGLAWDTFGEANGFTDFEAFLKAIARLKETTPSGVGEIGCVVLSNPMYFERPYDTGKRMYGPIEYPHVRAPLADALIAHLHTQPQASASPSVAERPALGKPQVIIPRLGQGTFRILVTESYERRCAVTGERTLPALEAAHIKPFSVVREHRIQNGILLRSDLHKLFDQGYVSIRPDSKFVVSKRIREEFENGRDYYALNETAIRGPSRDENRPEVENLDWHYSVIFKG